MMEYDKTLYQLVFKYNDTKKQIKSAVMPPPPEIYVMPSPILHWQQYSQPPSQLSRNHQYQMVCMSLLQDISIIVNNLGKSLVNHIRIGWILAKSWLNWYNRGSVVVPYGEVVLPVLKMFTDLRPQYESHDKAPSAQWPTRLYYNSTTLAAWFDSVLWPPWYFKGTLKYRGALANCSEWCRLYKKGPRLYSDHR